VLSLLLIYMTVFNPLAWRYNYVSVGIAYLYVLHALWRGVQRQRLVITIAVGSYLLHFAPDAMQALGARLWGTAALAVAVVLCRHRGIQLPPESAALPSQNAFTPLRADTRGF
jgi:hypothetical protein